MWVTALLMVLCLVAGVGIARLAVAAGLIPESLRMPSALAITFFLLTFGEIRFARTEPRAPFLRRLLGGLVVAGLMFAVGYFAA
jgi:hypothetical protein